MSDLELAVAAVQSHAVMTDDMPYGTNAAPGNQPMWSRQLAPTALPSQWYDQAGSAFNPSFDIDMYVSSLRSPYGLQMASQGPTLDRPYAVTWDLQESQDSLSHFGDRNARGEATSMRPFETLTGIASRTSRPTFNDCAQATDAETALSPDGGVVTRPAPLPGTPSYLQALEPFQPVTLPPDCADGRSTEMPQLSEALTFHAPRDPRQPMQVSRAGGDTITDGQAVISAAAKGATAIRPPHSTDTEASQASSPSAIRVWYMSTAGKRVRGRGAHSRRFAGFMEGSLSGTDRGVALRILRAGEEAWGLSSGSKANITFGDGNTNMKDESKAWTESLQARCQAKGAAVWVQATIPLGNHDSLMKKIRSGTSLVNPAILLWGERDTVLENAGLDPSKHPDLLPYYRTGRLYLDLPEGPKSSRGIRLFKKPGSKKLMRVEPTNPVYYLPELRIKTSG